ncbi:Probable polygalacturonase At1g80170 [Linum perenne]
MVLHGIRESESTVCSVLSICGEVGGLRDGIQVHCRVVKLGYGCNVFVGSSLVGVYMDMGLEGLGLGLFRELPERNLATWNLVLRRFSELRRADELLGLYDVMREEGVEGNGVTFSYLIHGCCDERFCNEGKKLHSHLIKVGWESSNLFVANGLVDFYSARGRLSDAKRSFEVIRAEDVLSWNSMLAAYVSNGFVLEAVELFNAMQFFSKRPSIRSFVGFLNFASRTADALLGKQIHSWVLKVGFAVGSVHVQSALIDMYGKCRDIESSVSFFYGYVPERSLECCNSLMTSLLHCGIIEDVVEMFGLMVDEGTGLDEVTFSTVLKALSDSTSFSSLASCSMVHSCVTKLGFETDLAVSSSLIDAYSKTGCVKLARNVFKQLTSPNVICYTAMISGYAHNGMGNEGLEMLKEMMLKGLTPDKVTFLCVLNGCSHSGLVEEGRMAFDVMKLMYGIPPNRRHFSCMVDLLGRSGMLNEAEELLHQYPGKGDWIMWSSLLQSCRNHKNETVGRRAAKVLMDVDPGDFAVYLQVSNYYAEIGEYDLSMQIRETGIMQINQVPTNQVAEKKQIKSMDRIFVISVLGLLLVGHGVAGSMVYDTLGMVEELEEELEVFDVPSWTSERGSKVLVNVESFGAVGDGVADDSQAFVNAWKTACNTTKSVFLVPPGRSYLVNATRFKGPCADKLIIQIDGTIVAPDEPANWDPSFPRTWLDFSKLNGVVFQGHGVIDGSGSKWWAASCKKNKSNALTIESSTGVKVQGLTIQNSQQMNFVISHCNSVRITDVLVSAPGDSPNTDGIHITESTNVVLQDTKIGTGDDCVSIVSGSSNIKMKRLYCGPGHGISIGSLGKDNSTGFVSKVVVDTALLRDTTNGLRIKTWQGGHGYVRGIRYENVQMENVANPIIIDQFYCDSPKSCQNQSAAVEISQIMYRNISGTSKSAKAMKFACSDTVPCSNIVLTNVNLEGKDGMVETYCNSAQGSGYGVVRPSIDCLTAKDKEIVHTEL